MKTFCFLKKEPIIAILYILILYLFLHKTIFDQNFVLYGGKDMQRIHIPSREYLYENLKEGKFPFWIEYKLSGYPIYADLPNQFLNPLNVTLVYLFGPYISLILLIFITYFVGSIAFYKLLKRHNSTLLGFICAHSIYFFNLYIFFHTQHLGILLTSYLIPLSLYLLPKLQRKWTGALFLALFDVYLLTIGAFQLILISYIARVIYYLCFLYTKKGFHKDLLKLVSYILLTAVLSLPFLLPSIQLYSYSNFTGRVSSFEGSIYPVNLLVGVIPFIYGKEGYFNGYKFCQGCNIQELYFYFGISTSLLFITSILFVNKKKEYIFSFSLIALSILLSVLGTDPSIKIYNLFPLNLFRYWNRSLILLILGISFGVNGFISRKDFKKTYLKQVIPYFVLFLFLLSFQIYVKNIRYIKEFWFYVSHYSYKNPHAHMKIWITLLLLYLVCLIMFYFSKKHKNLIKYFLVLLVTVDLVIFSSISIKQNGFIPKKELPSNSICLSNLENIEKNTRVLDLSGCLNSLNTHATDLWSVLGRSQYTNTKYTKSLEQLGLNESREIDKNYGIELMKTIDLGSAKKFGIAYVYSPDGDIIDLNNPIIPHPDIYVTEVYPGKVSAVTNKNQVNTNTVNTYIKYYPGWKVIADNKPIEISNEPGQFISFDITPDTSEILIKYEPRALIFGGFLSVGLLPFVLLFSKRLYV